MMLKDYQFIRHVDITSPYMKKPSAGGTGFRHSMQSVEVEASLHGFGIYAECEHPVAEEHFNGCVAEIKQVLEEYDKIEESFSIHEEESVSGPTSFFYEDDENNGVNFMTIEGENLTKDEIYESVRRFVNKLEECGHID